MWMRPTAASRKEALTAYKERKREAPPTASRRSKHRSRGLGERPRQITSEDPCALTSSGLIVLLLLRDLACCSTASGSPVGPFWPGIRYPRRQDVVGGVEGLQQDIHRNDSGKRRCVRRGDSTGRQPPQGRTQQRHITPVSSVHGGD